MEQFFSGAKPDSSADDSNRFEFGDVDLATNESCFDLCSVKGGNQGFVLGIFWSSSSYEPTDQKVGDFI